MDNAIPGPGSFPAEYGSPLTSEDQELIEYARRIVDDNGDGALHTVGSAVRDVDGRMHGGINLYHFTGGPCAELVALGNARARGARQLTTIVAVGDHGRGVMSPCGRDRQVLLDYYAGIRVLLPTDRGVRSVPIQQLLPTAFRAANGVRQQVRFHPDYLEPVRSGAKRTTIRFHDPFHTGPADLVFELDEEVVLHGDVTRTSHKHVHDLTDDDARADGFADLAELMERLRFHYPDLQPTDEIDVVHFELER
ncbi:ASCH domain-containing protein [Flindersiella endophytica]